MWNIFTINFIIVYDLRTVTENLDSDDGHNICNVSLHGQVWNTIWTILHFIKIWKLRKNPYRISFWRVACVDAIDSLEHFESFIPSSTRHEELWRLIKETYTTPRQKTRYSRHCKEDTPGVVCDVTSKKCPWPGLWNQ